MTNDVVLALGEIDCREGMLRAVDSLKYDSFPAALEATVALYHRIVQASRPLRCITAQL